MVVKKIMYEKEYFSRKSEVCKGTGNFSQITAQEDNELRHEIQEKFDVKGTNGSGFDGEQLYYFDVIGNPNSKINEEKSINYKTTYFIKKAGTNISKNCDLEEFLLTKGFKKIE